MQEEENKISLNDKVINIVSNNIVWIFLGFTIIVIIIPNLFARLSIFPFIKPDGKGLTPNEIGDAIGGMTTPIIGLFSAFLVYVAFRAQIKANEELSKQNSFLFFDKYENIINSLNKKLNEIKITDKNSNNYYGKDAISHLFNLTYHNEDIEKLHQLLEKHTQQINSYYFMACKTLEIIDSKNNFSPLEKIYLFENLSNFYFDHIIDKQNNIGKVKMVDMIESAEESFRNRYKDNIDNLKHKIIPSIISFNTRFDSLKQHIAKLKL